MEAIRKLFDFKVDSSIKPDIFIRIEMNALTIKNVKNEVDIANSREFIEMFETNVQKMFYNLPIDEVKDYRKYASSNVINLDFFKMFELSKYGNKHLKLGDRVLFYDEAYFTAWCNGFYTIADPNKYNSNIMIDVSFGFKLINPKLMLFIYNDKDEYKIYLRDKKFEKLD